MLIAIPSLLDAGRIDRIRSLIEQGQWEDGRATAGRQSTLAKRNLQIATSCTRGRTSTVAWTRGRSRSSRASSATPKTTRRITSRVRAFIRSRLRSSAPGVHRVTSSRANLVTTAS